MTVAIARPAATNGFVKKRIARPAPGMANHARPMMCSSSATQGFWRLVVVALRLEGPSPSLYQWRVASLPG